jgi:hypothetical protein
MIRLEIVNGSLQVSNNGSVILVAPKNSCAVDVLALYDDIPFVVIYNKYLGNSTVIFSQPLANCENSSGTPFNVATFIAFAEANLGFDGSVVGGCSPFRYDVNTTGIEPCLGSNNASGNYSTIGGGKNNGASYPCATVGGGYKNNADYNCTTIGGGYGNTARCYSATIGGGSVNLNYSRCGFIGGGTFNLLSNTTIFYPDYYVGSTLIFGGDQTASFSTSNKFIAVSNDYSYSGVINSVFYDVGSNYTCLGTDIAFGATVKLVNLSTASNAGRASTIGGGFANKNIGNCSTIGGGFLNTASNNNVTIGGGQCNIASGNNSTIGGGQSNTASGCGSTIGGGQSNTASVCLSTIGGGGSNIASGCLSTIGGGDNNTSSGIRSVISGGLINIASATYSIIGGGLCNTTTSRHSVISGGQRNVIQSPTNECCSLGATIGGGIGHNSTGGTFDATTGNLTGIIFCCNAGKLSTIGGGFRNINMGACGFIGGGYFNSITSNFGVIGGGQCNTVGATYTTISGGACNTANGSRSTISGGQCNASGGTCTVIGGGANNTASGVTSAILGGRSNNTNTCACAMIVGSNITADRICATFVNNLSIKNIPTASAGLPSGSVWNNLGTLNIVT